MPKLRNNTEIQLLGTTGVVKWKQAKDGTLILDLSNIDNKELSTLYHAWVFRIPAVIR